MRALRWIALVLFGGQVGPTLAGVLLAPSLAGDVLFLGAGLACVGSALLTLYVLWRLGLRIVPRRRWMFFIPYVGEWLTDAWPLMVPIYGELWWLGRVGDYMSLLEGERRARQPDRAAPGYGERWPRRPS